MSRWQLLIVWQLLPLSSIAQDDLLDLYSDMEQAEAAPTEVRERFENAGTQVVTQTVQVRVTGVRNTTGSIRVLLFDDPTAFARLDVSAAVGYHSFSAAEATNNHKLSAYGTGPFAAFVLHDENDNERLDMNGPRPQEGYAYSGALEPFLPPPFSAAARITETLSVRLNYFTNRMRR